MRRLAARAQHHSAGYLKEWRKRCGQSQLDLAVAVRTTQRHVSVIEIRSGGAEPKFDPAVVGRDGYSVAGGGRPWFVRYA